MVFHGYITSATSGLDPLPFSGLRATHLLWVKVNFFFFSFLWTRCYIPPKTTVCLFLCKWPPSWITSTLRLYRSFFPVGFFYCPAAPAGHDGTNNGHDEVLFYLFIFFLSFLNKGITDSPYSGAIIFFFFFASNSAQLITHVQTIQKIFVFLFFSFLQPEADHFQE